MLNGPNDWEWMRATRPSLTALLLVFAGSPMLRAEAFTGWPTTDWEVFCYLPTCAEWYGTSEPCSDAGNTPGWNAYSIEVWQSEDFWDGKKECSKEEVGPNREQAEQLLEQASQWLESMDFRPPLMPMDPAGTKYLAFIAPRYSAVSIAGEQPTDGNGDFLARPFYLPPRPEIPGLGRGALIILAPNPKDIAHELFHAIQYNSPAWSGGYGSVAAWIEEGTAEAVGLTFAANDQKGKRSYDEILHWAATPEQAYEDQFFWRRAGRQIGSQDNIAYLQKILGRNLLGPRGIDGVDTVFKEEADGLYDVLPDFFSYLSIHQDYFGAVDNIKASLPAGRDRHEEEFDSGVNRVAGSAHQLEVDFPNDGAVRQLEVEISFKEDHEDLHLIVDGQRYDVTGPRNLYRDVLVHGPGKKYDIIVANVNREAVQSNNRSYHLKVSLRRVDWCTMTARVSGDVGGSYFGDIAHFSTTGGATIYGTFSNPERITGVAEFLGNVTEMAGGEDASEEIQAMAEEFAAEASEIPRETFGLSLSDQKLEDDAQQALAHLAGGFTLEASVIGPEVGKGVTGGIPLKMLRVVPGPRAESTLDKVPFVWVEGAPGSAQLFITRNTGDLVAGRISGTLHAEGYYKPGGDAPVIVVQASFVALEGPTGCLGVMSSF